MQLKSMKQKISNISSLTHYHFHLNKFTGTKTDVLQRFIIGNVDSHHISIQKSLRIPHTIFHHYHQGTFMSVAKQNPSRLFILSHVLKPDKLQGDFSKEKS